MANFDKIAPFFDNYLIQFCYRRAHQQCLDFIKNYIKDNTRILEIGCGTGNFLHRLEKMNKNFEVFGIDESGKMIEIARRKFQNINFQEGLAENLPFVDNYFDFIVIIDAFYYFEDKNKVIAECFRVLKPNGFLFLYTPSIDQFLSKVLVWLSKLSPTESKSKHLCYKDLKLLIRDVGFQIIEKKLSPWPFLVLAKYWMILCKK